MILSRIRLPTTPAKTYVTRTAAILGRSAHGKSPPDFESEPIRASVANVPGPLGSRTTPVNNAPACRRRGEPNASRASSVTPNICLSREQDPKTHQSAKAPIKRGGHRLHEPAAGVIANQSGDGIVAAGAEHGRLPNRIHSASAHATAPAAAEKCVTMNALLSHSSTTIHCRH